MRSSTIILIAALAVGLVAAAGVFVYTEGAEARVLADQQPTAVYVTDDLVPAGMVLDDAIQEGLILSTQVPASSAPSGALTVGSSGSLQALADLGPGQVVLAAAFGSEMPAPEPIRIAADEFAVTVQLGDPQRVAGFLRPGSSVAIFNTSADLDRSNETRLLLFGIQVLAIGEATQVQAEGDPTDVAQSALVTVAVKPTEAERLVHAAQTGSLYLALLNPEAQRATTPGVRDSDLYLEEQS
jgi:pilus assembly protein CpaB